MQHNYRAPWPLVLQAAADPAVTGLLLLLPPALAATCRPRRCWQVLLAVAGASGVAHAVAATGYFALAQPGEAANMIASAAVA